MAQSLSPTPLHAPEDLAFLLPRQIQGVAPTVEGQTGMSATTTSDSTFARYQDLLIGLGKEPSDLRIAEAHTTDPSAPEQYEIYAMRVDGVAADILFDRFFPAACGADVPPYPEMPTMTFGDRTVISREPDEPS